ncbi:TIGR03084 family metal-binding protein [Nonomuraea soli]|uniref:Uncharacterized protein (TIGR03084 family) n=1 Tax=Nonomuraea soli TaxID=1032476 RepID=A0A7W0CNQ0_9ACTN|nr:TIGR03084 family metal-binding protein [Nonomuraea soli]MBA2894559.1 uncharacterized protein (TIGR03084 family) [Nonomuraea soli]
MDLIGELLDDLRAETADLNDLLRPLRSDDWELPTPAQGWAIRDQVSHLAYFDEAATRAVADPIGFRASLAEVSAQFVDDQVDESRILLAEEVAEWFSRARATMLETFATLGAKDRVPWYGPDMSAASFVTARLMETWAHGQDVADAVKVERRPTARLRHVALIGCQARPYSYAVRGLQPPSRPVRVELSLPDGTPWTHGPQDAADRVSGTALDFCLVVTQRIHRDDTGLETTGEAAAEWMGIAQAFAGPPGSGRASGANQGDTG